MILTENKFKENLKTDVKSQPQNTKVQLSHRLPSNFSAMRAKMRILNMKSRKT